VIRTKSNQHHSSNRRGDRGTSQTHMPHITAYLAHLNQKIQRRHPLLSTESGLARKVMKMGYQSLKDVCQTLIRALRVDFDCVLGDVMYIHVLHGRQLAKDFGRVHVCG